jgi:hypothetical protein
MEHGEDFQPVFAVTLAGRVGIPRLHLAQPSGTVDKLWTAFAPRSPAISGHADAAFLSKWCRRKSAVATDTWRDFRRDVCRL